MLCWNVPLLTAIAKPLSISPVTSTTKMIIFREILHPKVWSVLTLKPILRLSKFSQANPWVFPAKPILLKNPHFTPHLHFQPLVNIIYTTYSVFPAAKFMAHHSVLQSPFFSISYFYSDPMANI